MEWRSGRCDTDVARRTGTSGEVWWVLYHWVSADHQGCGSNVHLFDVPHVAGYEPALRRMGGAEELREQGAGGWRGWRVLGGSSTPL